MIIKEFQEKRKKIKMTRLRKTLWKYEIAVQSKAQTELVYSGDVLWIVLQRKEWKSLLSANRKRSLTDLKGKFYGNDW